MHDDYSGSQIAAAQSYLRTIPPGHRGLITITLWGNDIREFLRSCPDVQCVQQKAPGEIAAFTKRLQEAVSRLAALAPRAQIIIVGAYSITSDPLSDQLFAALNAAMDSVQNAGFANPAPFFNPPSGRQAALCPLTFLCTSNDSHPSPAGHVVLASTILNV